MTHKIAMVWSRSKFLIQGVLLAMPYLLLLLLMLTDRLKRRRILVLYLPRPTHIAHISPVLDRLRGNPRLSFYVARERGQGQSGYGRLGIPAHRFFDRRLSRLALPVDLLLSVDIPVHAARRVDRVLIGHGRPTKVEMFPKEWFESVNVHFLNSPLLREQTLRTIEHYALQGKSIKLFNIGQPKSDALLRGDYSRQGVLESVGLDPSKPTVLYAPSWNEGLSLRYYGDKIFEKMLSVQGVNVIAKLHPLCYLFPGNPRLSGGINWVQRLRKFEIYGNFRHLSEFSENIDPLLEASDVMVTDLSSVALEFLILDKPVVYIDCPEFWDKKLGSEWGFYLTTSPRGMRDNPEVNGGRHCGVVVENIEDLPAAIVRSVTYPGEFSDKRRTFSEQLVYNPGRAAEAAAEKILELLDGKA